MRADGYAPPADVPSPVKPTWPKGATAGLLLVAVGCVAVGMLLYKAADPGYEIEKKNAARDWTAVDLPRPQR